MNTTLMQARLSKRASRRGGVLVCVLVVLLLVGMLSAQAFQTLSAARRGDQQRLRLRQARELLELGRVIAVDGKTLNDSNREVQFDVPVDGENIGRLSVRLVDAPEGETRYQVTAEYPAGANRGSIATFNSWE